MPAPPESLEIVTTFDLPHGGPAQVVQWAEVTGASPPPATIVDADAVADAFEDWYLAPGGIGALFATTVTIEEVVVTTRGTVPQQQVVRSIATAGNGAGDALPAETALVTSWYSAAGVGKRYRGRNYWPGVSEAHNVAGQFNPAEVATFQALFEDLITRVDATSCELAVYSRVDSATRGALSVLLRPTFHHISRRNP